MNLLGAALYDPGTAVSKATSALLAMTAFDTTNLRLTVTVPAHGKLRIRLCTVITGATTVPIVFLGVMNGSTVVARVNPMDFPGTMSGATQTAPCVADFVVTGLTPGSITLDAAYGVEVVVASTNIKYGGPNNTTGADAWGAFQYEIWDPQPLAISSAALVIDSSGRVDVSKVAGTSQTARDLGAQLDATVSSRMATYTQPTGFLTATFPSTVASPTNITAGTITTVTNLTNLPSIPNNWLTAAGIAASALNGKGDWNIGKTGYALTAAYDAAKTALAASSYTAPDNTSITAIKAKTDSLTFTVAGKLDGNIKAVNDITVNGSGTAGSPWGP